MAARKTTPPASPANDTLVAIGDMHAPWHDAVVLFDIILAIEKLQPKFVVQLGDCYDQYAFSRYGKSLNVATPADELTRAHATISTMWSEIRTRSPASKCYQLLGNHDVRLNKRVMEKLPELESIIDVSALFEFPGVESMKSDRDVLELKVQGHPWVAHHGFLSKIGDHLRYFQKSCITGHSHRAHVVPLRIHDRLLWEVNAGYVADPKAPVFSYGATVKNSWTPGYAVIDSLGPRVVSLEPK